MRQFPLYRQLDKMDCGFTCLRMIAKYHGVVFPMEYYTQFHHQSKNGISLLKLSEIAEQIGFRTLLSKVSFEKLDEEAALPCILHWKNHHFVVLTPQDYSRKSKRGKIEIADPSFGLLKLDKETFLKFWLRPGEDVGYILLIEPSKSSYKM